MFMFLLYFIFTVLTLSIKTMITHMSSVSSTTMTSIEQILTIENKPTNWKNILAKDIKLRIKLLNLHCKKDFLMTCITKSIVTPEIENLAKKIVSENKSNVRQIREERRILRYRVDEKINQITDCNKEIREHFRNVKKLNLSEFAVNEYSQIKKAELNSKWNVTKLRAKEKSEE